MLICHLSLVMGMVPETSSAVAMGTQQQQAKPGEDMAQGSEHQGGMNRGRSGREQERHQGGMR
eukprot:919109-Karenia_brevis.AAC.1